MNANQCFLSLKLSCIEKTGHLCFKVESRHFYRDLPFTADVVYMDSVLYLGVSIQVKTQDIFWISGRSAKGCKNLPDTEKLVFGELFDREKEAPGKSPTHLQSFGKSFPIGLQSF